MSLEDVIRTVRPSVVQVCVHTVDGDDHQVLGTGFFVGDTGRVVTAKHVVPRTLEDGLDQLCIAVAAPDIPGLNGFSDGLPTFIHMKAKLVASDDVNDLALIQLAHGPVGPKLTATAEGIDGRFSLELTPVQFAQTRLEAGVRIASSGFPLAQPALVTTTGTIAAAYATDENDALRVLGDLTLNVGNSGGPVYLAETGAVVGMASSGLTAPADVPDAMRGQIRTLGGLALIVPTTTVIQFLAIVGIEPVFFAAD